MKRRRSTGLPRGNEVGENGRQGRDDGMGIGTSLASAVGVTGLN